MDKEVLISISGLQYEIDKDEAMEVISPGKYYLKNGKHYVLYEEITELPGEDSGISKVLIKMDNNTIELTKKGYTNVSMLFEQGKKTMSCYRTPFGELLVGIYTTEIQIEEKQNGILAVINYSLDINYGHISDCNIIIKVINRK